MADGAEVRVLQDDIGILSSRLDNMESLLYKISEGLSKEAHDGNVSDGSKSDSNYCSLSPQHSKHKRSSRCDDSPSKFDVFSYESLFEDDDIHIQTFPQVTMAPFHTLVNLNEAGVDISGFLENSKFLSEKDIMPVIVSILIGVPGVTSVVMLCLNVPRPERRRPLNMSHQFKR